MWGCDCYVAMTNMLIACRVDPSTDSSTQVLNRMRWPECEPVFFFISAHADGNRQRGYEGSEGLGTGEGFDQASLFGTSGPAQPPSALTVGVLRDEKKNRARASSCFQ